MNVKESHDILIAQESDKLIEQDKIVSEAKDQANTEADKILLSSKEQINNEKLKAITELKNQVADMSIDIAEKILRSELSDVNKQKELVAQVLKSNESN